MTDRMRALFRRRPMPYDDNPSRDEAEEIYRHNHGLQDNYENIQVD